MIPPKTPPRGERERLTALVTHYRPEWDGARVAAELYDALSLLPAALVEEIAREAAADPDAQTPRVIGYRAKREADRRAAEARAREARANARACTSPHCDGKCQAHRTSGPSAEWLAARAQMHARA